MKSKIDPTELALNDKLVYLNRVSKVVKGGKRLSFSALVVTGDGNGHVGIGMGKSNEVPEAINKAGAVAKKNLIKVQLNDNAEPDKSDLEDITRKTKILMGESCKVDFDFVEDIRRTASGKFVYTLCKVK